MPAPRANLTSWWAVSVFDAALTVVPVLDAELGHNKVAKTTVLVSPTQSVSAQLTAKATVSKTVTPTISASAHRIQTITASLTVTPTFQALSGVIAKSTLTVSPTITASAIVIKAPRPEKLNVAVSRAATI